MAVSTLLVAGLSGLVAGNYGERYLLRQLTGESEKAIATLAVSVLEPVISEDISILKSIVTEMVRLDQNLYSIEIYNERGEILVDWHHHEKLSTEQLLHFSRDISFEGEQFGSIGVAISTSEINRIIGEAMSQVWVATVIPLCLLTGIILLFINRLVLTPLNNIRDRILALTSGDLETRIEIKTARELEILALTVNRLGAALRVEKAQQGELEKAQAALFEAKELAEVTLHSIGDAVITTDRAGLVRSLNPVAEKMTGWKNQRAVGVSVDKVFHIVDRDSRQPTDSPIHDCLMTDKTVELSGDTCLISLNGDESIIKDSAAPIRSCSGEILGAVLVFHDITHASKLTDRLTYEARHDPLTSLANRNAFEDHLLELLEEAMIHMSEHVLLYLDLDQFKIVNDTCGHIAGDALLMQLSSLMREQVRSNDMLARLGGDEFGALLTNCPLKKGAHIAEKIRKTIEDFRFCWQDHCFNVGVSIGVIPLTMESRDVKSVLTAADHACYRAKDNGRNQVVTYTPDDDELAKRTGETWWASRIQQALDENKFTLYHQPIVSIDRPNETGLHYEILIRMLDDDRLIPPGAFFPAAERYGMMPQIDQWVMRTYFEWIKKNPLQLEQLQLCAINLSGEFLSQKWALEFVSAEIEKSGMPPGKICFELTETVAVANMTNAVLFMAGLKKKGCLFALDDFGTGMSSFGYLRNLPVDFIKIDGSFVKDIQSDPVDLAMVRSINTIAHEMGKKTVAEYVENDEILQLLREIDVDYAQGYGISKPMPLFSDPLLMMSD
ncbi:MAG: EAL domain-containing protein [Sedimenticola sp.]